MHGQIEFYSLCAMLVREARKRGLALPTDPDPDNDDTKAFFRKVATGLGVTKDMKPEIVTYWNTSKDEDDGRMYLTRRDGVIGTY
jgi:hypothetical protein